MSHKPLYDITPFTVLDYPDHLAAIFWFSKCNMRCVYCYNKDIVLREGNMDEGEALAFLKSRRGLLEAVVLSGGEATLYKDLALFCKRIKELKFKIKLDTNGLNPEMVQLLVENSLVDYIALDYKAPKEKYLEITKDKHFDNFSRTLNFLIRKEFAFEVRTTVHSDLLRAEEINRIMNDLVKRGYGGTYYLQPFVFTENTIGKIQVAKAPLDTARISNALKVVWR
ncbi:anaerobic ribonucleoside-triphosphate reductase activating protein [Sulfurovum sp. XGS-02]|uniref:anaerobic ribonucleoside-triphosphate reductase activating protein n=1 Tax=Sulfurovum sp. XGS-02 TaxID=2925411 RepID=UPI00206ED742|nr:anaerobic ribonucleoside-triphosphate reductase activating protein [Sulfurovum sp. XGS-02]UPT77784.1 anaerobic ribonucleoside-triphosphate reductase activating protein [Sulfurovum sp. XGS-02]